MSDWIKTDTAIYRRDKISGVRIYRDWLYRVEVLIEGGWRSYYACEAVYDSGKRLGEVEHAKALEIYRELCGELE